MSELSRARNKISALKKDIRRLEGLLKGVSKPSPCVRELIQADDHDNEQTMFELIFKNVITELKDNFISLWKTYQEAIQEVCLTLKFPCSKLNTQCRVVYILQLY
jgi:hypothetical protein